MAKGNKKFDRQPARDYSEYSTAGKLVHWADPQSSGLVLAGGLVLLLSLSCYSLISVVAYTSLSFVLLGVGCKIYVHLMGMLKKPCKDPLAQIAIVDLTLSEETAQQYGNCLTSQLNSVVSCGRSLFLGENLYSSVKFGVLLYFLTCVGSVFNTITLLTLTWVGAFVFPKVYEANQDSMDDLFATVKDRYEALDSKIATILPGQKPAEQAKAE